MIMHPDPCEYDTITLEEARQIVQGTRNGILTDEDKFVAKSNANAPAFEERRRRRDADMQDDDEFNKYGC